MIRKVWLIASNTFVETLRQPVFCLIVFIAGYLIAFSPCFTMFTLLENVKLVQDMGLASIFLAGLTLAVFSAYNVISQEIEKRTVLTLMSKPVGRVEFILGKYLGIAGALAIGLYLLLALLVLTVRIGVPEAAYTKLDRVALWIEMVAILVTVVLGISANYFFDKPFTSSTMLYGAVVFTVCLVTAGFLDKNGQPQTFFANMSVPTVVAGVLLLMGVLVLAAAAVAVATRANFGITLVVCALVFLLGLMSDYLFGRHAGTSVVARVVYALVPNLQVFWVTDAVTSNRPIPFGYVCKVGCYAGVYSLGMVMAGVALFQEREIS